MSMVRLNVPSVFIYGGSILPGKYKGKDVTVVDVFEAVGKHSSGKMTAEELRKLDWLQRQIAFIIELRDALAPQVQAIIQYLGDLIVLILTKVVGRSIGLIGRGIAQGMGKNLSKG